MNILLEFTSQQQNLLIAGCVAAGILLLFIIILVVVKVRKKNKSTVAKNNTKYTNPDSLKKTPQQVTFSVGDFLVKTGEKYTASKKGQLLPGKYLVKASNSNQKSFYLRVNGINVNYTDGSEMVLAEGDTIEAVNSNVILR